MNTNPNNALFKEKSLKISMLFFDSSNMCSLKVFVCIEEVRGYAINHSDGSRTLSWVDFIACGSRPLLNHGFANPSGFATPQVMADRDGRRSDPGNGRSSRTDPSVLEPYPSFSPTGDLKSGNVTSRLICHMYRQNAIFPSPTRSVWRSPRRLCWR